MSRTATILGKVSVTPKGAWNGANSYNFLDIVSNAGSSYLAVQPVAAGTPLDNTSYWLQIAAKGDPGQDGTDGAAGEITGASASISGGVGTPGVTVTPGGTPTARTFTFAFVNLKGEQGETGNGIASIVKTATAGLVDTYTVTYTDGTIMTYEVKNGAEALDATLTLEGYAADAKAVGDALALKQNAADPAGLADNLTPYSADSGAEQSVPFINQGTGCGNGESVVDTGSYAQVKKKLGNTVGVNLLVNPANYEADKTVDGVSFEKLADGRIKITVDSSPANAVRFRVTNVNVFTLGHKYLFSLQSNYGAGKLNVMIANATYSSIAVGQDNLYDTIWQAVGDVTQWAFIVNVRAGCATGTYYVRPISSDLDRWFGSTDRIPSDLLSHPENWGRYYAGSLAYNPGQLVNADGSVLTSIGRNCNSGDDDVLAIPNQAYYCKGTATITYKDRGGNTISTASVTDTSFTTPADCFSFGVSGTGVTISLYYSGESGYTSDYPYSVLAQIDTGSEVLRSAGSVADEKTPDGTITRNVGEPVTLDLSAMTFRQEGGGETAQWYSNDQPFASYKMPATNADRANAQSGRFVCMAYTSLASGSGFGITSTGRLGISNDIYTNRAAYTSVEFFCEAAAPTTEQGTPFSGASADNFAIDDFGSMYWTQTNGVPQGVEIFYPYDYKAAVDTLLNMVSGDVEKLVTETELGAVSDRIPEAPAEDGTYTLKATVASGVKTYAWVAE